MHSLTQSLALPREVLHIAETQWLFTEPELLQTPSIAAGLPSETERENRSKGVNFILQVGIMLKLPQITLATASIFLHRFFMRHSMKWPEHSNGYHHYEVGATSLFLATKVEENCRKMKELVIACCRVAQKDPHKLVDEQDKEYWRWRDVILLNEDVMLEALCFDLSLEPPYKTLFEQLVYFGEGDNTRLRNAAWAFVNDSYLTMLCLLFSSRTTATSALYAAAKHCGVTFPDDEQGRPWWDTLGVRLDDIRRACNYMASVYAGMPSKAGRESSMYQQIPGVENDANDRTRGAGHKEQAFRSPSRDRVNGSTVSPSNSEESEAGRRRETHSERAESVEKPPTNGDMEDLSDKLYDGIVQKRQMVENGFTGQLNGTTTVHSTNSDADGLLYRHNDQSPKPDDVSEEGELEA